MRFIASIFWNFQQLRLRAGWRLGLQTVVMSILLIMLSFIELAIPPFLPRSWIDKLDPNGLIGIVSQFPLIMISIWLAGRFFDRRNWRDFGFHISAQWWLNFGFGLVLGASLMTLIFMVELVMGWVEVDKFFLTRPDTPFMFSWLIQLFIFICVGIYEETLSRGYQLRNLAEGLNFRWVGPNVSLILACLISSALFGLAHLANPNATIISTILVCVAGVFLSLGYLLTGELAIPIGLHIAWNFFQGNVFGFPVSGVYAGVSMISVYQKGPVWITGGAFGPEAGLIGLVAITLGCVLIIAWVKWKNISVQLAADLAIYTPLQHTNKPQTNSAEPDAIHPESLDKPE